MRRRALYLEITLALHAWRRGNPAAACGNAVQAIYAWASAGHCIVQGDCNA